MTHKSYLGFLSLSGPSYIQPVFVVVPASVPSANDVGKPLVGDDEAVSQNVGIDEARRCLFCNIDDLFSTRCGDERRDIRSAICEFCELLRTEAQRIELAGFSGMLPQK